MLVVTLQVAIPTWPDLRSVEASLLSALPAFGGGTLLGTQLCPTVLSVQDLSEMEGEQIGRKCDRVLSGGRQMCAHKHTCSGEYKAVKSQSSN